MQRFPTSGHEALSGGPLSISRCYSFSMQFYQMLFSALSKMSNFSYKHYHYYAENGEFKLIFNAVVW